jgi:hypothetical protein
MAEGQVQAGASMEVAEKPIEVRSYEVVVAALAGMTMEVNRIAVAQETRLNAARNLARSKFFARLPEAVQDDLVKLMDGEPAGPMTRTDAENVKNAAIVYGLPAAIYEDDVDEWMVAV